MANKIKVKLIMELRAAGMSQREISRTCTNHLIHKPGIICEVD